MPAEPPPIMALFDWERIKSHLPYTTPISALILIACLSLFIFYRMLRLIFQPRPPPPPRYTGDLNPAGLYHGRGELRLRNGNLYRGEFRDGKFEGKGVYLFKATATQYEGAFVDGRCEGRGVEGYADGSRYEGQFRAGEREGQGRMEYGNGGAYEGGWKAGKKHGNGKVREGKEGPWTAGVWVEGKLRKAEKVSGDDGTEGKYVLDDELPKDVQEKERRRKEEAKVKQGKGS